MDSDSAVLLWLIQLTVLSSECGKGFREGPAQLGSHPSSGGDGVSSAMPGSLKQLEWGNRLRNCLKTEKSSLLTFARPDTQGV